MKNRIFLTSIMLFLTTHSWGAKLLIKSQPEAADIFITTNGKPIRLGSTPYQADLNEIIASYIKTDSFLIELKKPGHMPYRLLLAKTNDVDIELTANLELDKAVSNLKEHDALMNKLFNVQKLIRSRNFKDAIEELSVLEKSYPDFSIIPELKATAYYMNKDVENALSYYRRA